MRPPGDAGEGDADRDDPDGRILELLRDLTRARDPLPEALRTTLYAFAPGPPGDG